MHEVCFQRRAVSGAIFQTLGAPIVETQLGGWGDCFEQPWRDEIPVPTSTPCRVSVQGEGHVISVGPTTSIV